MRRKLGFRCVCIFRIRDMCVTGNQFFSPDHVFLKSQKWEYGVVRVFPFLPLFSLEQHKKPRSVTYVSPDGPGCLYSEMCDRPAPSLAVPCSLGHRPLGFLSVPRARRGTCEHAGTASGTRLRGQELLMKWGPRKDLKKIITKMNKNKS